MIDKNYNYLIGKASDLPQDFDIDLRIDPDTCGCKKLYNDIIEAYFSDTQLNIKNGIVKVENKEQKISNNPAFYTIFVNAGKYLLSSDCIGPSVYWARERAVNDDKIRYFLNVSRTIGGHIVWPRGRELKKKINTSRGGKSGVYDRMDWTLLLISIFYETDNKEQYLQRANELIPREFRYKNNFNSKFEGMYEAFICARSWFESFGTFEMFCKQFKLSGKGNFVDENYKVNIMTALFPILPNDYEEYIENVCSAINVRNSLINP